MKVSYVYYIYYVLYNLLIFQTLLEALAAERAVVPILAKVIFHRINSFRLRRATNHIIQLHDVEC